MTRSNPHDPPPTVFLPPRLTPGLLRGLGGPQTVGEDRSRSLYDLGDREDQDDRFFRRFQGHHSDRDDLQDHFNQGDQGDRDDRSFLGDHDYQDDIHGRV